MNRSRTGLDTGSIFKNWRYRKSLPDQDKKNVLGLDWTGYRIYLQKLKVPEEVSSKPREKERGEKWLKKWRKAKFRSQIRVGKLFDEIIRVSFAPLEFTPLHFSDLKSSAILLHELWFFTNCQDISSNFCNFFAFFRRDSYWNLGDVRSLDQILCLKKTLHSELKFVGI